MSSNSSKSKPLLQIRVFVTKNLLILGVVDVSTIYALDLKKTWLKGCPKAVREAHNPQIFQKKSVKLATQVMSASVSRGLRAAYAVGALKKPTALNTALI